MNSEEFLLMMEEDIVRVGVDKVGAVRKLLAGQEEKNKADWTKSCLHCIRPEQGGSHAEHNHCYHHGGHGHWSLANISQHAIATAQTTWGEAGGEI